MKNSMIFFLLMAVILTTACSTTRHGFTGHHGELTGVNDRSQATPYGQVENILSLDEAKLELAEKPVAPIQRRKIIQNAYLRLAVDQPDSMSKELTQLAESMNGYVAQSGTYETIIRIPSDQFEVAIDRIAMMGKISSKNISGEDVTNQYYDLQIRIENAQKARKRYLELLDQAENVETALKVEKELERLNTELDRLKGQMKRLENLTSFSTITVRHEERKKPGPLGYVGIGLYKFVKWFFVRN